MERYISIHEGNALEFECDVLILKYAQRLYGVDKAVFERISPTRAELEQQLPDVGKYLLMQANGVISARWILFIGTKTLHQFSYNDISKFAKSSMEICASEIPDARRIALTIHGVGFGLDESEAFYAQVVGLNEAIAEGLLPPVLRSIVIVERDHRRFGRLQQSLRDMSAPDGDAPLLVGKSMALSQGTIPLGNKIAFEGARRSATEIRRPGSKPSIFVAMPFATDLDDTFFYGIQKPIEQIGYLCERADLASFTGDVMTWVRKKINSAELIVAELTGSNPNVYLEVGFAWGIGKASVLVVRKGSELKFDVSGQRCLFYSSIRELEEKLLNELRSLLNR